MQAKKTGAQSVLDFTPECRSEDRFVVLVETAFVANEVSREDQIFSSCCKALPG